MKKQAFIKHLDYYIPKDVLYFKDHLDYFETEGIREAFKTGEEFYTFTQNILQLDKVSVEREMTLHQMAEGLLRKNVEAGKLVPENIDYVLLAADYSYHLENFGQYIQNNLGMSNANVIRISDNFCNNIDVAINIASNLIKAEDYTHNILIVAGCKEGFSLNRRLVGSYGVIGDAAGMIIVSSKGEDALVEIKHQETVTKGVLDKIDHSKDNTLLHFQSYVESLQKLLKRHNLAPSDVDRVILHNANHMLVEQCLFNAGIDAAIDKTNQTKYGHLGTVDLIYNLQTYLENDTALKSENILTLNIGVLGAYASTLFISNPDRSSRWEVKGTQQEAV